MRLDQAKNIVIHIFFSDSVPFALLSSGFMVSIGSCLLYTSDLYSMDMFGESIEGHKYKTPYQVMKMINPNSKEDMELLSKLPWVTGKFDDEDE